MFCITSSKVCSSKSKEWEHHWKTVGKPDCIFLDWLIVTLRINCFVLPLNCIEVVWCILHLPRQFEHKLWTERMESNVPKASWQEMSRRDMHLQRASHRQGFVGRFLLCVAALCQGLLSPPEPPFPKHLKKRIRPFCQSERWHHSCCFAQKF